MKAFRISALLLAAMLMFSSCTEDMVSDSRIAMGTLVTVSLPERDAAAMDDVFSLIYEIDGEISRFSEKSWIGRINEAAGSAPVQVPEEIYSLVKEAVEMAYRTGGVFNPAVGPLSSLWALGTEDARVPSQDEISRVLPLLDYTLIELDDSDHSVFLPLPGMALDLGGVGKGYASDKVAELLGALGVGSALVNLGGNVLAYGTRPDGEPWRIGIRDPEGDASSYFIVVDVSDSTVITSGGYQRYIEKDGVRYHHILNSETGYPYETDILSATVISSSGTLGDMLSTTLFAEGSDKAMASARAFGVRCILLLEDGSVLDSDSSDGDVAVMEE